MPSLASLTSTNVVPLFPFDIRTSRPKYVVSSHPFASSPSSLNGTGYGRRRGPNGNGPSGVALISKYAKSNAKSMRPRGVHFVDARGGAEAEVAVVSELHHLVHPVVPVFRSPQSNSLLDRKRFQRCYCALDW